MRIITTKAISGPSRRIRGGGGCGSWRGSSNNNSDPLRVLLLRRLSIMTTATLILYSLSLATPSLVQGAGFLSSLDITPNHVERHHHHHHRITKQFLAQQQVVQREVRIFPGESTTTRLYATSSTARPTARSAAVASAPQPPSGAKAKPRSRTRRGGGRRGHHHNNARQRTQIRRLFQTAKDLERKGQWRKAASTLRSILTMDPADSHSHLALARLEARRRISSTEEPNHRATEAFANGTQACPRSVHLWQAWAVYEDSCGNTERARELFGRAMEIDPANPYVCHAYGLMERKLDNNDKAQQLWERGVARTSTAALVCSLGELFIANQELRKARDLYVRHLVRLKTARERTEVYLASAWLEERYFGNADRAEELIKLSLELSPTSSRAQVALARLEGRRRQNQQGEDEIRTATVRHLASACMGTENGSSKQKPDDGRIYNAWAKVEVESKRYAAARKILQKGVERYPNDHSLLQAAGKVEERVGNFTGARALYSASLLIQPSAPTLVAYAMLEIKHPDCGECDFEKVKGLFEEALLLNPRHGPAYNAYGKFIFEQNGNAEEARAVFERGIRAQCFDSASIYHGAAKLELSVGNLDRARELLYKGRREAKRHDLSMDSPHRERALFLTHTLGMLELNTNHPSESLEIFTDGIERYGNSSQLLLGAALCEVKLGNAAKARRQFKLSVVNDKKHAQAWCGWAVMEMRAGNPDTARTLFECGIKSSPKHGDLWHTFGAMEGRLGNPGRARDLFSKGIRLCPEHSPLYRSWASLELREENLNAAKVLITKTLTMDKRNGAGWRIASEIEERLGNSGLANLILRRGIECCSTDAELYRTLGHSLISKGKIDEAREILERGIEVDKTHAPLYHTLAELEARVCNIEGLANLNKRAAEVFNTNALQPPDSSAEAWGARIRPRWQQSHTIPAGVRALAERIVDDEDGESEPGSDITDPGAFLDEMGSNLMEGGLVGQLLLLEEQEDLPPLENES